MHENTLRALSHSHYFAIKRLMFVLIKNRIHSLVIRKRSISYLPLDIWGGGLMSILVVLFFIRCRLVVCCGNDDSISLIIIFFRQAKNLGLLFGYWTANSSFKLMKKTFIQHESIVLLILFFPFLIFSSIYFSAFIFFFSYSSPSILIVDRHNLVELFLLLLFLLLLQYMCFVPFPTL